jgi:hypothetical protein
VVVRKPQPKEIAMTNNQNNMPQPEIPGGTRVLNTTDGEPGRVMNGYAFDRGSGEWTEYEVETRDAIEIWKRSEFVLFSEIETND